jgi:hypothetical protein
MGTIKMSVKDGKLISVRTETKTDIALRFSAAALAGIWELTRAKQVTGWRRKVSYGLAGLQLVMVSLGLGIIINVMQKEEEFPSHRR